MFCARLSSRIVRSLTPITVALFIVAFQSPMTTAQTAEFTQGSKHSNTLTFEVPLGNYPGRGISLPVTLRYSSAGLWRVGFINSVQVNVWGYNIHRSVAESIYAEHSTAGWKTSLDVPKIEWPKLNDRYFANGNPYARGYVYPYTHRVANVYVHMPDGSTHELRKADQIYQDNNYVDMTGTFYAVDGSRMRYDSTAETTGTLYLADGTRWIFNGGTVQYIDRNGNTLNYNTATRQWTDTLGRVFSMPWPANPSAGDYSYQLPGVNGSTLNYTIKFRHLSEVLAPGTPALQPMGDHYLPNPSAPPTSQSGGNFPQPTGTSTMFTSEYVDEDNQASYTYVVGRTQSGANVFNPVVLSEVVLPNGRNYAFSYNNYGELAKVVLPTGGYQRYAHAYAPPLAFVNVPFNQGSRGMSSQWVSPSGNTSDEAQWTYSTTGTTLTVIAPDSTGAPNGTRSETLIHYNSAPTSNFGYQDARTGLPYEERVYAPVSQGGAMLRRSLTEYAQTSATYNRPSPYSGTYTAYRNARATKSVSLMLDTGGNALASSTTTSYDTTYQFSVGLDATASNEYGFAIVDQTTAQTAPISSMPFGPFVRGTQTTFLTYDAGYRDRNILGLANSVTILSAASQIVAQSTIAYDEASYPLLTYGGLNGWTDPQTSYRGNATTASRWLDYPTSTWISTHTQYDQAGSVRYAWDARGNQSQVEYSATYAHAFPTQTTSAVPDPTGTHGTTTPLVASTVYDFNTGLVTSTTDANSKTTSFEYNDPLNRRTRVNLPDGGRTTTTYVDTHTCGAYVQTRTLLTASGTETDSYTFFDGIGRPYRAFTYENQDTSNPWLTADTQYDSMGRGYRTSNPYRSTGCASAINPSGNWTTNTYDSLSRAISVITPDGAQVSTAYSAVTTGSYIGPSVTVTDQALKARKSISDSSGRVIQVIEDPNGVAYQTNYTYDALNNLRKVEQGSQVRFYGYDSLSRVLRVSTVEQTANAALNWSDPVTGNNSWTMGLSYDANGNVTSRVDARNITSTLSYDTLNRNFAVTYSDGTATVYRYFDGAVNGRGRLYWDQAVGVSARVFDEYDAVGRPTRYHQVFWVNGNWGSHFNVQRVYDKAGSVTGQTYPSGHTVNYSYDSAARLASFNGNLGEGVQRTYTSGLSYSQFGALAQEQFGTQTSLFHKRHYNVRGQLYDIRVSTLSLTQNEFDWNRGCLAFYYGGAAWGQSSASNNGNVTLQQHWVPADESYSNYSYTQNTYNYDSLNRLEWTGEVHGGPWGQSGWDYAAQYDYDRYGNRTVNQASWGVPKPNYSVDPNTNRLIAPAGFNYGYDETGNQTNDTYTGQGTRTYDAENHMKQAWSNNQWQTYVYDGSGQRIKRIVNGVETWQIYGIGGELLAEYAAGAPTFIPTKEYGYRGGELLITANSGDDQRMKRFVEALYFGAFARVPTSTELQQQTSTLAQAGAQGPSQLQTAATNMAIGFFQSTEYVNRNRTDREYVSDLYNAYLQRAPEQGGWDYWTNLVPINGRYNVMLGFVYSAEFATLVSTLYGTSASDNARTDQFVRVSYIGALSRDPDGTEIQQQRDALNNAAAAGLSQVQAQAETMLRGLFNSQEYINRGRADRDYVWDLYETFLQRAPDQAGWDYWTSQVPINGRADVLNAFAVCAPFRELAGTIYREVNWLVTDRLGTPRMVVDRNGSLAGIKRHDYLPFGEELYAGVGGRTSAQGYTASDNVRQKFTGYERDAESGLDYAQARYYASQQGRFTSVDPLGASAHIANPQSFNRYSYVNNNPTNMTDPSGMMPASMGWSSVADGFWGGGFDFGSPPASAGRDIIAAAEAHRDRLVKARTDGALAQHYLNNRNYRAANAIFSANSDVGLFAGGVDLWGALANAYVDGASQPLEVAQNLGIPQGVQDYAIRKGLEAAARLVQKARKPDFYILSAAWGIQGTAAVTRSCTFTVSIGGTGGNVASLMAGWILTLSRPSDETVVGFLTGPAWGGDIFWNPRTGVGAGVGAGFIHSPNASGRRWAVTIGAGLGGGFSGGTGWKVADWDTLRRYSVYAVPLIR